LEPARIPALTTKQHKLKETLTAVSAVPADTPARAEKIPVGVGDETLPTDALPTNLTDAFAHSCKLTWPVHCLKAGRQCKIPASLVKIPEVTLKASKIRIQNIKELMQVCSICTSRSIC